MPSAKKNCEDSSYLPFGRSVFICSKPLQFFNCISIITSERIATPILIVVTQSIADCGGFKLYCEHSTYRHLFSAIVFVETHKEAAGVLQSYSPYDTIFVDSDRVGEYRLYKHKKTRFMFVYEEGFGTYVPPSTNKHQNPARRLISLIRRLYFACVIGVGNHYGASRRTDGVFVTDKKLYQRLNPSYTKPIVEFPSISDNMLAVLRDVDMYTDMPFSGIAKDDSVALILGTWGGARGLEESIFDENDYTFIYYKGHPHDGASCDLTGAITLKQSWVPAECILASIVTRARNLVVFHYSSSAYFYSRKIPNVRFVDLLKAPRFVSLVEGISRQLNA